MARRALIVSAVALVCAACVTEPDTVVGDPNNPNADRPRSPGELYADDVVWDIDLRLSDDALAALQREPRIYVDGDVKIGDAIIRGVGIRLKGNFSFQNLDGKSSFKVKFNKFVPAQRFVGLEKLTLNNMRQDRSQIHEWLGYRVFRAAGVPAPRSSFARVSVNREPYGLYANVETVDDRFLAANYDDPDGNLYEAGWMADLAPESLELFEQDEGEDQSRIDLDVLAARVAEPGDGVFFSDDAPIDTDEFLRFVASEALIGHWDGYWKSNNYFIYHEISRGKWTFLPWGIDQSWDRDLQPFSSAGVLADKCIRVTSCRSEYARIGLEVVDAIDELDLLADIDRVAALIEDYVAEDPRTPQPPDKVERYIDVARATVAVVTDRLRDRFSCMVDGVEQDRDGDGYGGCVFDCDDSSALARPGGIEVCDGLDNDCDRFTDEAGCPCTEAEIAGDTYLFCDVLVKWTIARDECEARGGRLATLEDEALSEAAFDIAESIAPNRSWYIGVHDSEEEGSWQSTLGVDMSFQYFAAGEPDDFGGQDCAVLASYSGGTWADENCGVALPYICAVSP